MFNYAHALVVLGRFVPLLACVLCLGLPGFGRPAARYCLVSKGKCAVHMVLRAASVIGRRVYSQFILLIDHLGVYVFVGNLVAILYFILIFLLTSPLAVYFCFAPSLPVSYLLVWVPSNARLEAGRRDHRKWDAPTSCFITFINPNIAISRRYNYIQKKEYDQAAFNELERVCCAQFVDWNPGGWPVGIHIDIGETSASVSSFLSPTSPISRVFLREVSPVDLQI